MRSSRTSVQRTRTSSISRRRLRAVQIQSQLGLLYTSCNGKTSKAAQVIQRQLGAACSEPINLQDWTPSTGQLLQQYSGYIVGAPTYNTDAVSQRTGTYWDDWLYNGALQQLQLQGKPFAVFGCGDAVRFKSNFADAIGELHDVFTAAGSIPLTSSYTSPSTYLMANSKAIRHIHQYNSGWNHSSSSSSSGSGSSSSEGYFVGLPLDFHNQPELSASRINSWCSSLLQQLEQQYPDTLLPLTQDVPIGYQHAVLHTSHWSHEQQQQQQQLEIGCWPAAWPSQGDFYGEYPRGFRFTDRWYCLGNRWYRFADEGFQVRAGFREHAVYTYAYKDIISLEVKQQQQQQQQQAVEMWITVKDSSGSSSSGRGGGVSSKGRVLVLKDVECWAADGSNTIADFLTYQVNNCQHGLELVA